MPEDELEKRRKKLAEKLQEAEKLSAPASRAIQAVEKVRKSLSTNAQRTKSSKLAPVLPGLPGNSFGPMDWHEFYDFCHDTLGYYDMMPEPHDEMCGFVSELFPDFSFKGDEQHFGMMLVPRSCFKSVIFSVGLPLFILWKNRNARILLSGHRHDASKEQLRTIKWNLEHNEKFKALCGSWKPQFKEQKYAEDAIIILGRTEALRDPSVDTCGVDRSKVGAHPDVIICDDVHSETNVLTAIMRNKVLDHIVNMYPMLQPGGTMLVIGTRWHHADAYGKLLSLDKKAIEDGQKPTFKTLIRSCYNDDGSLYFPTRLTEKFLTETKYRVGKTKFSLWYLNKPIDDDDRLFPAEQLEKAKIEYFFDEDMGMPSMTVGGEYYPVNVTMAWDPAGINPTDKSDFHGITIVGCDPMGRWLIPCAEAIKAKPDAVLARIAAIILRYSPDCIIIENVGQSGTWAYLLRNYLERKGIHCPPIILYTPPSKQDKNSRIETLQPMFAAKEIIVDYRCKELIEQFDNFPQLDFDDLLDSVQMHREYAHPADPNTLDLLFDYEAMLPEHIKHIIKEDKRQRLGCYAGRGSSKWGSLEELD